MKYIIQKIITLIMTLLFISVLTFFLFSLIPGDASLSKLGSEATPERIEVLREEMGLNQPVYQRYFNWLFHVLQGDFGESYQYTGNSVQSLLVNRLPVTLWLAVISFFLILVFSIPLGILSAKKEGGIIDNGIQLSTRITMAIPPFFLGILMTYLFGIVLGWFQPGNFIMPQESVLGSIRYLVFPALAIALPKVAMVVRFLRNSIIDELDKDYVRTAYSKGNSKNGVFYKHIVRNAMIPVITFLALVAADILAGSIIVEQVFSIPGMGRLLVNAIANRDFPVVQAVVTYITTIVVILNFSVDILYRIIDPRIESA